MEIPGLYSARSKLEVSSFFSLRKPGAGELQAETLRGWQSWNNTECACFIAEVCKLPQYTDVAERNLTGAYMAELLQAGLLSKGLAKIGIGDFEHVRRITASIQALNPFTCADVSLSARRQKGRLSDRSQSTPPSACRSPKDMMSPSSRNSAKSPGRGKLLGKVFDGFESSLPEYQRRLASPPPVRLPTLKSSILLPNACPVEVSINFKPINYLFDGCHSPTVDHLRKGLLNKAASEAAIRFPYWTTGRCSPEPWGGQSQDTPALVKMRYSPGSVPNYSPAL